MTRPGAGFECQTNFDSDAAKVIAQGTHPAGDRSTGTQGYNDIQTIFDVYDNLLPSVHDALCAALDSPFAGSADRDDEDIPRIGGGASVARSIIRAMNALVAALIGVVVGALGSHLLTQRRERAAEERRARNICRLLFRDLMQIYFKVQSVVYGKPEQKWPPADGIPFEIKVENWRTLGPDFTMVCRDADLWESVCLAFEEAEFLDTDEEIDRYRLEKALERIEDAVERTAAVNRSWSNKVRNRWYARKREADGEEPRAL